MFGPKEQRLLISHYLDYAQKVFKNCFCFGVLSAFFLIFSTAVSAIEKPGEELKEVGLSTQLGAKVDLSLPFTTSDGREVPLNQMVGGKRPIVLIPVYYTCPRLCGLLLNGALHLFNQLNLQMGSEYEVITLSFDPSEGPELSSKRESEYKGKLSKVGADKNGWHFVTGTKERISALMEQIGFKYFKDKDEYAHTAAIIILTPQGEISQYFTGIDFSSWDVRLAIIEASQGKIGSLIDHFLLFCFRYDHAEGKYTWAVFNLLRLVGLATILALLAIILFAVRDKQRKGILKV